MTLSTLHLAHECKWVNCVSASRAAVRLLRRIPLTMERLHSSRTRESECLCEQKLRKTRNVDETLMKNTGLFSVKIGTSHSEKGRNNFTWWIISWRKMFIQRQKTSKAYFIEISIRIMRFSLVYIMWHNEFDEPNFGKHIRDRLFIRSTTILLNCNLQFCANFPDRFVLTYVRDFIQFCDVAKKWRHRQLD